MDKQFLNEINTAYYRLELKQAEIAHALFHRIFELESGWYSGHYHKGDNGNWFRESYHIPVIGVKGFCDIEIQFDKISVSTKLKRNTALAYSFEKFVGHEFEAYGGLPCGLLPSRTDRAEIEREHSCLRCKGNRLSLLMLRGNRFLSL